MTRYTPTYSSWQCMKQRCYNPNKDSFKNYGGRGITVCDRWLNSSANFLADMGPRPEGYTLERRDVNGNYEPTNCYWDTPKQQSLNRRRFTITRLNSTPNISKQWNKYWVRICIDKYKTHSLGFNTLEEAEAHRDICIYERDFLISRGF